MRLVDRIRNGLRALGGVPVLSSRGSRVYIRGRYDAAQTTDDNRRHWALADGLSANLAASPGVRRTLRNRSRYEVANNSYARGLVLTLSNDCIGTGPRLQMVGLGGADAQLVERLFLEWCLSVDLAEKLRLMRGSMVEDGEAFGLMTANPVIDAPVKLDLQLVEADQIATPNLAWRTWGGSAVDGLELDRFGNAVIYHLLRQHPGDGGFWPATYDRLAADQVIHCFRPDRPGQRRGIPEITPALPLFAQLRRYTLAVIAAAETAADYAGIVYTDAPAGGEADQVEPMDTIALEKRALLTMPSGWKMEQMRAEQPATTYAEFKREILNEIARCVCTPYNIAAGNSSGYNFASGRLDHQTYDMYLRIERSRISRRVLDRILSTWVKEALLVDGLLPPRLRSPDTSWAHQWFWDGREHVDPVKEAMAQAKRLESHTTTLADEYARKGQDWEAQLRQRAREQALVRELKLDLQPTVPPASLAAPPSPPADPTDPPNPDAGDDADA
jgi:lambda family phage portal protein